MTDPNYLRRLQLAAGRVLKASLAARLIDHGVRHVTVGWASNLDDNYDIRVRRVVGHGAESLDFPPDADLKIVWAQVLLWL